MKGPRVRFLNVQPYGGNFLISDPYGISREIVVTPQMLFLMSLMDGSRDGREIRAEFLRRTGTILGEEEYKELVSFLREGGYLYNEEFLNRLESKRRELLESGRKVPFHAGSAYPAEREELERFISESIQGDGADTPVGLIVPHMDLRVAISTYGKVYGSVGWEPETVVVMGVSHYLHESHFSVCPLDYETPLGTVEVDREVVNRLRDLFSHDIFRDILAYEREHSVEFQMIFVKHLFPTAKAVPLIVSHGDEGLLRETAEKLVKALKGRNALLISSVDLSHVGRKFGDERSYDPSPRDTEYLGLLEDLKGEEAFRLLRSDGNRTRIDGQFTNFVFTEALKLLGAERGRRIDYQKHYEEPTDSVVTYAGMIFR